MKFNLVTEKQEGYKHGAWTEDLKIEQVTARLYVQEGNTNHFLVEKCIDGQPAQFTHVCGDIGGAISDMDAFICENCHWPTEGE